MSTPVKKKLESQATSRNDTHKATNAPERPFQRNGLKKLSSKQLDDEIRASAKNWHLLTRTAQTLARERLLPVIKEVARRIKAGKRVAGHTGIEAYIKSLGLPPSLVRKWRFNERKKNDEKSAAGLMQNLNARTQGGYYRRDMTSWFHKALRRGDEDAALFCASELDLTGLRGHVWNTLIVTASEDVGLADNSVIVRLLGLFKTAKALADDSDMAQHFVVAAVQLVAHARKSRLTDEALNAVYNAGWHDKSEPLVSEVEKLDRTGRGGEAWNKLRLIASECDAGVSVQIRVLYEHWKNFAGKHYEESDEGATNRIFLIHAALLCQRAKKTRETQTVYADRAKRKVPDYALDFHSRTGQNDHNRKRDTAEGVRHFLEDGAKLVNEDKSIPNPYKHAYEEWMRSKVKKTARAAGAAAGRA